VCVALALLLSFAGAMVATERAPTSAFYLAHLRAWELLVGSLLALRALPELRSPRLHGPLAVLGLALIGYAVYAFSHLTLFPGASALVPCLGTALVIYASTGSSSRVQRLLGSRLLVSIGLLSYALYLWHWPLLVFARKLSIVPLKPWQTALVLVATLLCAVASRRFVEEPIRRRKVLPSRDGVFGAAAAATLCAVALAHVLMETHGLPGRVPGEVLALEKQGAGYSREAMEHSCNRGTIRLSPRRHQRYCEFGSAESDRGVFVWGDSHAAALTPSIARAAKQLKLTGVMYNRVGCSPALGVWKRFDKDRKCPKFNAAALAKLSSPSIDHVVLAARWSLWVEGTGVGDERLARHTLEDALGFSARPANMAVKFKHGLERTLRMMRKLDKRVTVVRQVPEVGTDVPVALARKRWLGLDRDIRPKRVAYDVRRSRMSRILDELGRKYEFDVVDPAQALCGTKRCAVERRGRSIYGDDDHVNAEAAPMLTPLFRAALDKMSKS
jgi:hypothetical protein